MKFLLVVFLLITTPCFAQQVIVVKPDGSSVAYVPQKTRTVVRQKTVYDSVWLVVHDTVRTDTVQKEYFQREIEPVFVSVKVESLHDTITVFPKENPPMLPFVAVGFYGQPHTTASPYAGIGLQWLDGHFGVSGGARLQYWWGEDADPSIGIILPQRPTWQVVFEGELQFYLY